MKMLDPAARRGFVRLLGVALLVGSAAVAAVPAQRLAPVPTGFGRDGDQMGAAVAVLGDTLVAGSPYARPATDISSGAAQVFRNGASGWQREAVLQPSHLVSDQRFGSAVAVGDGVVAIGAFTAFSYETFVFRRNGTSWVQTDDLTFGGLPALSGDELAVGGTSSVRIYADVDGSWVPEADLAVADPATERVTDVRFSGNVIAFLTAAHSFGTGDYVSMYLYTRVGDVWTHDTTLDLGLWFAGLTLAPSVAVSNETAIVATVNGVEIRTRGDGSWPVEQMLDAGISWTDLGGPTSVAIDGDRAVVGCDGRFSSSVQGSVIVFEKSGGIWSRVSRPYDTSASAGDGFGASVALSGTQLVAGSPGAVIEGVHSGKVTPVVVDGTTWTAGASLGEGNAHADGYFGSAIALSGTTAFVVSLEPGAPVVIHDYEVEGDRWVEAAQLESPGENPYASFAMAMVLDGDTAVVSSRGDRFDGTDNWNALYVYGRVAGGWEIVQRIESATPIPTFGVTLALDGDRLAVGDVNNMGGPGRVVIYVRSGGLWTEQATIQPDDSAPNDFFGTTLALSGATLAVGSPTANDGIETRAGAAYVFADVGGSWQQQARLTAPTPFQDRAFGTSLALAGDTLLVGAQRPTGASDDVAFSFVRDGATWRYDAALSIPGAPDNDFQAGFEVALSADATVALVGAPAGTSGTPAGEVYRFVRNEGAWSIASVLHGQTWPNGNDSFGGRIVISGSDALIAAPGERPGGAAYVVPIGDPVFASGFD
ncbi:MAG: hypothetical protein ABW186_07090 [Rhodanobacteraceae bacterium]